MKYVSIKQNSVQLQSLIDKGEVFFNLDSFEAQHDFLKSWEIYLKYKSGQLNFEELFLKYLVLDRFIQDLLSLFKEFRLVEFVGATEIQKEQLLIIQGYLSQLEECSIRDVLQECIHICLQGEPLWDEELGDIFHTLVNLLKSIEKFVFSNLTVQEEWF